MKYLKKFIFHLASLAVFTLLYFNLTLWDRKWLGIFLFLLFFALNGILWKKIFGKVFKMRHGDFIVGLYAWFAVFLLLSLISSVFVVWHKITPMIIWLVFLIVQIIGEAVKFFVKRSEDNRNFILESHGYKYSLPESVAVKKHVLYVILFVSLWLAGIFLLSGNAGSGIVNSPWQIIDKYYIIVFFSLTVVLFLICLSKHKVKLAIFFLILHSVLAHMYLPASHELPWGGDVWRHLAIENKLIQGEAHLPVLFGPEAKWREVAGIDLPEALLIPNKYFYGQLWGGSVLIASVLKLDLLFVNIWLIPLLWGIMIPVIMFRIGRLLFGSWRSGLLLALFVSLLFPFQALGGLTLPVSLGYLTFFFVLMLWLQYLKDGKIIQRNLVFLFAWLMLFGYSLHFILIWLVIAVSLLIQYLSKNNLPAKNLFQNKFLRMPMISVGIIILALFFPLVEYLMGSSYFLKSPAVFSKLTQIAGQFSGWYFAGAIRPHDILTGNIIFNHTPDYAFVSNIFMNFRWPTVAFVLFLYMAMFVGLFFSGKKKNSVGLKISRYLFLSVAGGYFISWFFMEGDHSLVRRLDATLAYCLIIFSLLGIFVLFKKVQSVNLQKIFILALVLLFSWATATTYASGPDMRSAGKSEYETAVWLWNNIGSEPENVCVIADAWTLLILEALSSQKIVGGGFPIDSQFGQEERVKLYNEIREKKAENFAQTAHTLSGKTKCFVVLPKNEVNLDMEEFIADEFNDNGDLVGEFVVWEEMNIETSGGI